MTDKRFGQKIIGIHDIRRRESRAFARERVVSGSQVTVVFSAYELVVGAQELWRDGRRVRLAPQAMRILIELRPRRIPLVIRAVQLDTGIHADDRTLLDATVASLQVLVGRLDPARLFVSA